MPWVVVTLFELYPSLTVLPSARLPDRDPPSLSREVMPGICLAA